MRYAIRGINDASALHAADVGISVFDYLTFGVLLFILRATPDQFRTGWFLESVASAALIVLVLRSRKLFFKSRPSKPLFMATLLVLLVTVIFPLEPHDEDCGPQRPADHRSASDSSELLRDIGRIRWV